MPRNPRSCINGNFFHVMVQGIAKDYVFPDDNCKGYYLKCLQDAKKRVPASILAFCVMGNHAHVLVGVSNINNLSLYFKQVNSLYANYYNRVHRRVGHVFRDRFKSQIIASESHLTNCLAYIQNNPLVAGMVDNAEEYGFSSYSDYLRKTGIVDFDEAAKYYDISKENIIAIMQERADVIWIEHREDIEFETKMDVLSELKKKYGIKSGAKISAEIAAVITKEMKQRCDVSIKEMADLLNIGRETLRRALIPVYS